VTPEAHAARLLAKHGVTAVPVPVEAIAGAEGIRVGRDRHDGPEYGFTCRIDGEGLTVGVNSNTSAQRQRCAVAHGIGHALIHMSEAVILVCRISRAGSPEARSTPSARQEAEATAFCAALVMPEAAVAEAAAGLAATLLREAGGCTAFTEAVARQFGVPAEVAAYRLASLGLLSV
jgi:Zn-dependent peptidase ImmA (M78 family)